MSTLVCISSYLKNEALEQLLETLLNHNYHEGNRIVITDDSDNFNALPVYNKFRKEAPLTYLGGSKNLGIAKNKNRGIKYFLEKPQYTHLLSLDDDLLFVRSGLIEHLKMATEADDIPFSTGFWSDFSAKEVDQMWGTGGWTEQFPKIAESEWHTWHGGCHGCLVFYKRETIEKVSFFNPDFPLGYGFEHSLYCSRILRAYSSSPELFPIMKFSQRFFHGNQIPNNYSINKDQVFELNGAHHKKLLLKVYQGYGIKIEEHGLKKALKSDRRLES